MEIQEESIAALLNSRDETAFEQVFKTHFKSLHAYVFSMLRDEVQAEEIVQQVFYKLWDRAENLSFSGSVAAYLYRAVHNESLNYIKHQQVRSKHQLHIAYSMNSGGEQQNSRLARKELQSKFQEALQELPEQCRTIFQLSRFDELKYREIADRLGISVKTVENQMGKALKFLRVKLVEFLPLIFIFFQF